jgi:spermidine/putrescine transport system substrate-binding protein
MEQGKDKAAVERSEKDVLGLIDEVKNGRITRKQFAYRALGLGLAAGTVGGLLAACGTDDTASTSSSPQPMDTTKPDEVYLYNWSDYMAPGTKKGFEAETGIKVIETYFDDNEALLAKLKAGASGYDVIVPSDYMVHIMIMSELLTPLDMQYIPNFQYVDEQFKAPVYDNPDSSENNGNRYSVPYQWGTTGYAVRMDKIGDNKYGTWKNIFPPEGDPLKGQLVMLNDEREDLGAALKMLGYSLNTTDQGQLDQATDQLIAQKPLVRQYDSVNMKRSIASGVPITMCWNGDALLAIDNMGGTEQAKKDVNFLLPTEGFAWWVDTFAVPKGYRSLYGAELFMNYVLTPEVMGKTSSWTWYLPVETEAAKPYCDPFVYTTTPTTEQMKSGEVISDLGAFGRNYTEAWAKVKSS